MVGARVRQPEDCTRRLEETSDPNGEGARSSEGRQVGKGRGSEAEVHGDYARRPEASLINDTTELSGVSDPNGEGARSLGRRPVGESHGALRMVLGNRRIHKQPPRKDGSKGDDESTRSAGDLQIDNCCMDEGLSRCLVPRRVDCCVNN